MGQTSEAGQARIVRRALMKAIEDTTDAALFEDKVGLVLLSSSSAVELVVVVVVVIEVVVLVVVVVVTGVATGVPIDFATKPELTDFAASLAFTALSTSVVEAVFILLSTLALWTM